MVVFGGFDEGHTNQVRRLNMHSMTWELCRVRGAIPAKRYGHAMCVWRDTAIVMGGQGTEGTACDDLYFLDLNSLTWTEVHARGERPPPSCYHTLLVWENYAIAYGGTDSTDVFVLDLEEQFWTRISPSGNTPQKRFGHAAVIWNGLCIISCGRRDTACNADFLVLALGRASMAWLPFAVDTSTIGERHAHAMAVVDDRLVLFGGHGGTYYNDTHVMRLTDMTWLPMAFVPEQRDGHSMFLWHDRVYLWGGDGGGGRRFQDLNVLDYETRLWRRVEQGGELPTRRSYHATDIWGHMLVLFGGYDASFTNDLHVMDLATCEWLPVDQSGAIPAPRYGHTLTIYNHYAYVFGGKGANSKYFGPEISRLNLLTLSWDTVETHGQPPAKRYGHCAFLRGKQLFIFGGSGLVFYNDLHALDLETLVWREVNTSGMRPIERSYHAISLWSDRLVVCGGDHGAGLRLNDVHLLDLRSMRWQTVAVRGTPPLVRCTHKLVVLRDKAILFGGRDAGTYFNDVRYLNLDPSIDEVARLFCTITLICEHNLLAQLPHTSENADVRAFISLVAGLPPELVMHVCTFAVPVPPHRLPSDARLRECRALMTSPEQSFHRAIAVLCVCVAEHVLGDLDLVSRSPGSFKAHLVRLLLGRTRACLLASCDFVSLSTQNRRKKVLRLLLSRLDCDGDQWDAPFARALLEPSDEEASAPMSIDG